jgi:hypothetical protein
MAREAISKLFYWIFNKSYYEAIIRENGNKIGVIIQKEPNNIKGGDAFLISRGLKKAWLKPYPNKKESGEILYTDGKKFICIVDIENSIPFTEEKTIVTTTSKYLIQTKEIIKFTEEKIPNRALKTGKGIVLDNDIPVAPSLLFELLEGIFVTQTASVPKSKWEELKWVFIVLIIVAGIVLWNLISSGTLSHF